jgi:predicted component of type VI protein secretion system
LPVVRYVDGDASRGLTIRFEISGQLVNGERRTAVRFESVIDATRTVRVE